MSTSRGHALRNYVIRRLLLMLPTFLGITLVVFLLCQFVPGGPIDQMRMQMAGAAGGGETVGDSGSATGSIDIPEAQLDALNEYYGFDKPIFPQRYLAYLSNLVRFDLGDSFRYNVPVESLIFKRLPVSIWFGACSFLITYLVCVPLGLIKALQHRSPADNVTSFLIFVMYAIPGYALGAVLLSLFAVQRDWFPLAGWQSSGFEELTTIEKVKDRAHHLVLPLICYSIHLFAVMTILMKNSVMENISADYVKTALAKGVTWPRAVFGHAFRNSLIPIATSFGGNIVLILAGSLLIERVFNIPGMGMLFFESITSRDYPVVLGYVVIASVLTMVGHLLSDLCVAAVDPRVRFE